MKVPVSARQSRQRGSAMIMFTLSLPVLLGLIGLAVDRTILFVVEAKLSAAVDGAALGAGRLLGTNANTTQIAADFLKADFCGSSCSYTGPTGYWGSYNLTPNITFTNSLGTYTISINASVTVPLLFLRTVPELVPQTATTVYASATAVRRAVRTIMVLDRSGSMSGTPFTNMQEGAETFASYFLPGTDEIGLVMFDTSAIVAYPTTYPLAYPPTMTTGGPDTSFDTSSTAGPLMTALQAMAVGTGTGTVEALSLAYMGLQQAHNRDLAANGVDNMLNSILLFTDGVPDAIAVSPNATQVWNVATNSWMTTTPVVTSASSCTYKSTSTTADTMMGTIVENGNAGSWTGQNGLFLLAGYYPSNTSTGNALSYWEANPSSGWGNGTLSQSKPVAALSGCATTAFGAGGGSPPTNYNLYHSSTNYVTGIPAYDIYGNSTSGTAYQYATLNQSNGTSTSPYSAGSYSATAITSANTLPIASWNAVDNVGNTIRSQTAMNQITIYSIGFSGDGGVDAGLLNRLANTPAAQPSGVNTSQPQGQYIQVDSVSQLVSAFQLVASYILHLSK
ncbi:MAG: pilus assembly protein TadG-related protein [Bryobacteraceae bacterium]